MAATAVLEVAYKGSSWSDGSLGAGDGGVCPRNGLAA